MSRVRAWPVVLISLPAAVAIWSGWVGLGQKTGFGEVQPFPGVPWLSRVQLDTAITLPIGMEAYAAYALRVWLSGDVPPRAKAFAQWSAIGALCLGASGQVAYHLMEAAGIDSAPWWITMLVACLPVAVCGMGAALLHLVRADEPTSSEQSSPVATSPTPGEAQTSVPGEAVGSPPATAGKAPRGRTTTKKTAFKVTPLEAAEAYVRAELAAKRTPSKRGAQVYMREHAGSGVRDEDFAPVFRDLVAKHSQPALHAVSREASA